MDKMMLGKVVLFFLSVNWVNSTICDLDPTPQTISLNDGGFKIRINEDPEKYVPGKVYTMYLMGSRTFNRIQHFQRFLVKVRSTEDLNDLTPQNVGSFQLYGDSLTKFNEDCVNTLSESNDVAKTEVFFMWTAPPPGSKCVTFQAQIQDTSGRIFNNLTKVFCEQNPMDLHMEDGCCTCNEARYHLTFEGIWSKSTHPKDFPTLLWLTHFSDLIGATHEKNFTIWSEGQIASEGFRSLAEWGSVSVLQTELRAKSKFLRTIFKAAGLWHPNVNSNTSTTFTVDRRHHLISLASMFGPSPDWIVGIDNLNLCLKNCTWIEDLTIDLYPYDAGTDSGTTYMSPNAETQPRERIFRINTTYPEDPRSPFYNPNSQQMVPLAKLYLKRTEVISRNCDDKIAENELEIDDVTDVNRMECAVTDYSDWSQCSVTCGKGLRMRTRQYKVPEKANMLKCNRQLISKEMCVAPSVPDCGDRNCATTDWGPWSECSETCGTGFRMRNRRFFERLDRKRCPHISTVEKEKCMGVPCGQGPEVPDPMCPTTEWSDWSPCSASCGKGVRFRTRLLLVDPGLQQKCSSRLELIQQTTCSLTTDCTFNMAKVKEICMEEPEMGTCTAYFRRWYFEPKKQMCIPFIYGGCRGNRNNFVTQDECQQTCGILSENPVLSPIDCMVSEWSDWGPCQFSNSEEDSFSERFRMIKRHPENGGKPCPNRLVKRRKCNH